MSSSSSPSRPSVLCIGELLWDALPRGLFLGGAPFNVAAHLHALGADVTLASRVGNDVLGDEAVRRVQGRGMSTQLIQRDPQHRTGFVEVDLDVDGVASYTIVEPAAWDTIELTPLLNHKAGRADAVVFGSLAQRNPTSRTTIQTVAQVATGWRVLDVNLRPPHTPRNVVEDALDLADVVKMNEEELDELCFWLDLPPSLDEGMHAVGEIFALEACCVTRGADGAVLWRAGELYTHGGVDTDVRDTVGAGDAFLAALLVGLLAGEDDEAVLDRACRTGAYVASKDGATPSLDDG